MELRAQKMGQHDAPRTPGAPSITPIGLYLTPMMNPDDRNGLLDEDEVNVLEEVLDVCESLEMQDVQHGPSAADEPASDA